MAIDVLLCREGNKLGAVDPISLDQLLSIKGNETVHATIRRPRNVKHHRKLWALLNAVFCHQELYPTTHELLNGLKIATGLFEQGRTVDGIPYIEPKSISFASMDQASFEQWYARAENVILTRILPNIGKEELEKEVLEIMEGRKNGRQC